MNHKPLNLSDESCRELRLKIENHLSDLAFYTACQDNHPFRRRAYKKVKANLYRFENVLPDYINNKKLKLIPGVGDTIASEITQFINTGQSKKLETLKVGVTKFIDPLKQAVGHPDWLANLVRKQHFSHPLQLFVAIESGWLANHQLITSNQCGQLRKELIKLLSPYQSKLLIRENLKLNNLVLLNYMPTDYLVDSEQQFLRGFDAIIYPVMQDQLRLAQRIFILSFLNQNHLPKTNTEFNDLVSNSNCKIFSSWMHPLFYSQSDRLTIPDEIKCVIILLHPLLEVFNGQLLEKIKPNIPIWYAGLSPGIETYLAGYAQAFSEKYVRQHSIVNKTSNSRLARFLENLMD